MAKTRGGWPELPFARRGGAGGSNAAHPSLWWRCAAGHPGGAANGIRAIAVQTGITPVEELVELQPDVMLKDLRELRLKMVEVV